MLRFGITPATPEEADRVVSMLEALNSELQHIGAIIRPGSKTSAWFRGIVNKGITGEGAVMIARASNDLIGTTVAVSSELPYNTAFQKVAFGFGTYVYPDYRKCGVASELYAAAKI